MDFSEIESMDIFQKLKVWNHYMVTVMSLRTKPNIEIYPMGTIGNGMFGGPCKFYNPNPKATQILPSLNQNSVLIDFWDWIDKEKNTRIMDNGQDWKKYGFAERIRTDYYGIYDWYWKFKDQI